MSLHTGDHRVSAQSTAPSHGEAANTISARPRLRKAGETGGGWHMSAGMNLGMTILALGSNVVKINICYHMFDFT